MFKIFKRLRQLEEDVDYLQFQVVRLEERNEEDYRKFKNIFDRHVEAETLPDLFSACTGEFMHEGQTKIVETFTIKEECLPETYECTEDWDNDDDEDGDWGEIDFDKVYQNGHDDGYQTGWREGCKAMTAVHEAVKEVDENEEAIQEGLDKLYKKEEKMTCEFICDKCNKSSKWNAMEEEIDNNEE